MSGYFPRVLQAKLSKGSGTVPAALAAGARRAWSRPFLRHLLRLKPPVQQQPRRRVNGPGLLCNLGALEDLRGLPPNNYFAWIIFFVAESVAVSNR